MPRDSSWADELTRPTVIVHLRHDGPSVKGVLAAVHSDALILSDALHLEPEAQTLMDGSTVIPRESIAYLQVLA